jgi:hypothetical protein
MQLVDNITVSAIQIFVANILFTQKFIDMKIRFLKNAVKIMSDRLLLLRFETKNKILTENNISFITTAKQLSTQILCFL